MRFSLISVTLFFSLCVSALPLPTEGNPVDIRIRDEITFSERDAQSLDARDDLDGEYPTLLGRAKPSLGGIATAASRFLQAAKKPPRLPVQRLAGASTLSNTAGGANKPQFPRLSVPSSITPAQRLSGFSALRPVSNSAGGSNKPQLPQPNPTNSNTGGVIAALKSLRAKNQAGSGQANPATAQRPGKNPKKKLTRAQQTARKQAKAAQANKNGKAMGPISPAQLAKQAAGKAKQKANNAKRKAAKNARNQANGNTQAAAQQRANKAGNAQWPARNAVITNGRDTVSGKDVRKTVFESNRHMAAGSHVLTKGRTPHPHQFNNFPNKQLAGPNGAYLNYAGAGGGGRPLNMNGPGTEFALTSPTFTGGKPGAMRVITQNGDYKGVVSHDPSKAKSGDLYKLNRREEDVVDLSA